MDLENFLNPQKDPLFIEADIGPDHRFTKIMVDNESIVGILYFDTFLKVGYKPELNSRSVYNSSRERSVQLNQYTFSRSWNSRSETESILK